MKYIFGIFLYLFCIKQMALSKAAGIPSNGNIDLNEPISPPRVNEYGQPIGEALPDWTPRPKPSNVTLTGRTCRVEPLDPEKHLEDLFAAYSQAPDNRDWTYMLYIEKVKDIEQFRKDVERTMEGSDRHFYVVIDLKTDKAVGMFSLWRIDQANGALEVGHVAFSPLLSRTIQSTEAQFLLMSYVFDQLGYRRYEWKCDSLHTMSRKAALRLGFTFEGIFRNGSVYKKRSRDIAWFSIIDKEWPARKAAFEAWLAPSNFDSAGQQIKTLAHFQGKLK